jgi:methyl-accepting chemotaxis protein
MTIKRFLMILGIVNTVLMAIVVTVFTTQNRQSMSAVNILVTHDMEILSGLNDLYSLGLQTGQATRNVVLNPSDNEAQGNYSKAHEGFLSSLNLTLALIDSKEKDSLSNIKELWMRDHALKTKIQELARAGEKEQALAKILEETKLWREIKSDILQLISNQKQQSNVKAQDMAVKFVTNRNTFLAVVLPVFIVSIGFLIFVGKAINRDMLHAITCFEQVGKGDLTVNLATKSKNEIGQLLGVMKHTVDGLRTIVKNIASGTDLLETSSSALITISGESARNAKDILARSNGVANAVEEMSSNLNNVAAASEQASTNVNMVAAASEEMTSTVREIAQNAAKARETTGMAVVSANGASSRVNELGEAASQINRVTEVITEISEQINLLALNATIEAARAGESGKGFAVVANEIKELAKQTANATQEIKSRVGGIQGSTGKTVSEIGRISIVIGEVNEIVCSIAAAVEEQSVSTQEISDNISQASQGIDEVNKNVNETSAVFSSIRNDIGDVNHRVQGITENSSQVDTKANDLELLAEKLQHLVGSFKV